VLLTPAPLDLGVSQSVCQSKVWCGVLLVAGACACACLCVWAGHWGPICRCPAPFSHGVSIAHACGSDTVPLSAVARSLAQVLLAVEVCGCKSVRLFVVLSAGGTHCSRSTVYCLLRMLRPICCSIGSTAVVAVAGVSCRAGSVPNACTAVPLCLCDCIHQSTTCGPLGE
jgi:hypothetical protein